MGVYIPGRGDIVHIEFDPATGSEMKGKHFGIVLSGKAFNASGLAMICPISQGHAGVARNVGLLVTLMGAGTETQGAVHCHQLKTLDWRIRRLKFKEKAPPFIVEEIQARLDAILNG